MNILPIIGAQNGDQDDVTIEMDIEVDGSSHIHDAVITVRDEDSVYPITGLGTLKPNILSPFMPKLFKMYAQIGAYSHDISYCNTLRMYMAFEANCCLQFGFYFVVRDLTRSANFSIYSNTNSGPTLRAYFCLCHALYLSLYEMPKQKCSLDYTILRP